MDLLAASGFSYYGMIGNQVKRKNKQLSSSTDTVSCIEAFNRAPYFANDNLEACFALLNCDGKD